MDEKHKVELNNDYLCSENWNRLISESKLSGLKGLFQNGFKAGYKRALEDMGVKVKNE